eukprot:TRINITY_DN3047_c0_g1_i5.p1 TRINITY_DN3047_c0_g1~~TRINITY_DN3047_c0_g1_i5.p1  ORF type:complete len:330 (-),score=43.74 TRINITY_DN3047_c0_g1_i5:135-1124(-)
MDHHLEEEPPVPGENTLLKKGLSMVGWYSVSIIYMLVSILTHANANNSICYRRLVIVNNLVLFFGTYFLRNLRHRQLNATGGIELGLQLWIIKFMNEYDYSNNPSRCLYQIDTNIFVLASTYFFRFAIALCSFLFIINVAFIASIIYSSLRRILNQEENQHSLANERNRGLTEEEIDQLPTILYEPPARDLSRTPLTEQGGALLEGSRLARAGPSPSPTAIVGERPTVSEGEDRMSCAICITPYNRGDLMIKLPVCNHTFHKTCLTNWLRLHSLCPYCRNNVRDALFNQAGNNNHEIEMVANPAGENGDDQLQRGNDQEQSNYMSFVDE